MRLFLRATVAMVATGLLLVIATPALAKPGMAPPEVPIAGTVMGDHWVDETAPGCADPDPGVVLLWRFSSSGTGKMSHLGRLDYVMTQCSYLDPAQGFLFRDGSITFTAANGDTLVIAQTGRSEVIGEMAGFTVEGTWEAAGGTGRFAHATGTGSMDGIGDIPGGDAVFDLPDGAAMFHFVGEIAYDASDRSGPVSAADDAMVRVLHASPDAPAVDVYVNGDKVGAPLEGLEFGDLSAYVKLPAGTYDLKVCATADAEVCPIVADGVAVAAGTHYTIAATNVLASIEAQIITDTPSPTDGKAQVRVVHFSADTPAVDVLTQDGSAKVVENLSYPNKTDYLTLAPGSYDLKVCATADNTICPLDPGPLALDAGTSYSVFAIGSLEGGSLTAAVGVDGIAAQSQ